MNAAVPIETAERVEAAAQLVTAGRHAEAQELLRAVLEREPGNADAINTLASIALARRDGRRAYENSRAGLHRLSRSCAAAVEPRHGVYVARTARGGDRMP